jgi:1-acyl-sn-glycerol-3-phosphate acyltransferase
MPAEKPMAVPPFVSRQDATRLGAVCRPFRPGRRLTWRMASGAILGMARLWLRLERVHLERVPAEGAFLIASTHTSHLDPMLLGPACGREAYYLARTGIMRVPGVGHWCRHFNTIAIRRGQSDRQALKACRQALQAGWPLVFFPEGTRSLDGRLGPIQGGFAMILEGLDIPYLPVVMQDTFRAFPRGAWMVRPAKTRIVFGEPARLPERQVGEASRDYHARCAADLERRWRDLGAQ